MPATIETAIKSNVLNLGLSQKRKCPSLGFNACTRL